MALDPARAAINRRVTGSPGVWPIEWLAATYPARPARFAVSLGCGAGELERDLLSKGLCERVLGVDCSARALDLARRRAQESGWGGHVEYRLADLELLPDLAHLGLAEGCAEMVFFHQSLHHLENVEGAVAGALALLEPGGLLYLDEYVGPSRNEWNEANLAVAAEVFSGLPRSARRRPRLVAPIDRHDPTEAQNSSAILPTVRARVPELVERPYGGNLLAVIWPWIAIDELDPAERNRLASELVAREDDLLAAGVPSYYAVLTGRR